MTKHFFSADFHFGHGNIMKYCHRTLWLNEEEKRLLQEGTDFRPSFESIRAMNQGIISNINKLVGPDDVLWFGGDWHFSSNKQYMDDAWEYRKRINCKKIYLFWGNHDHAGLEDCF